MRLIHCHLKIAADNMKRLAALLETDEFSVVLREDALNTLKQHPVLEQLTSLATVYALSDKLQGHSADETGKVDSLDYQGFVELCIKATQIIGWK